MAKLILFAAIMVVLLALAQASESTISSTVDEEGFESQQISKKCKQQIQQNFKQLDLCRRYLYSLEGEGNHPPLQGQQLSECCQGLRNLPGNQCRCKSIKDALNRVIESRQWAEQAKQHINKEARILPKRCQVGPRECPV